MLKLSGAGLQELNDARQTELRKNTARLLVLIELSRRLHQAYRHAYDKQAADRLLPQELGKPSHDAGSKQNPYPGCITANWFVNTPTARATFDEYWRQTQASGNENGGWFFYEPKTNTLLGKSASEGQKASMPTEPAEFDAQMSQFKQKGQSVIFMFDVHTHPSGSGNPSSGDLGNINSVRKKMASVGLPGGHFPIGIVISGSGQITLFDRNGRRFPNDKRLNECL